MQAIPMTPLPTEEEELIEESLSEIHECFEEGINEPEAVKNFVNDIVRPQVWETLLKKSYIRIDQNTLQFSEEARKISLQVIRRKRLAERLLKDVLNLDEKVVSPAACQWEHVLSKEVTNSICTFLGHPTHSPQEKPIPPGECCRNETKTAPQVIVSLDQMNRGDQGKIMYLLLKQKPELNRLLTMGLVPGTNIELIQRVPTFVVQAGESQLAFDESIAAAVFVHPYQNGKRFP